jgi:hypothetical protein
MSQELPKIVRFSKSQWDRLCPARKKAEAMLAERRGQRIEIYSKK